jgi:carbon monoxide dehydrogenase subunit G
MRISVSTPIAATPQTVWADVEHIASHVEWMADAESIEFQTETHAGVGTSFVCVTKVGPFRLRDVMTVTEWVDGEVMGIRHEGLVTGVGRFTLQAAGGGTAFTWVETLEFPWWMGGPLGAVCAKPVLSAIWRRNLRRLRARFEHADTGA